MRLLFLSLVCFLFSAVSFAQDDIISLKNVPDTVINPKRQLQVKDPFDALKTAQKLFPGKLYKLANDNTFISWSCKKCKTATYRDVNGTEEDPVFPFERGVATRLLDNIAYVDSKGNEFRLLFFNHSEYDEDGAQTGRFSGGLVGVAKFAKNDKTWQMRSFQPAIAAFGAFSSAPSPKLVEIGGDQYAFTIEHTNGGGGGPYSGYLYLIVGFNGTYQPLMELSYYSLFNNGEGSSKWSSSYKVIKDDKKKFFRDFAITTTGFYKKAKGTEDDFEVDLPPEIAAMAKTKKQFNFVIEKKVSFTGKWYNVVGKPTVKFSNAK